MKIKEGFVLRQVAGNYIIIGIGDDAVDFNGMITINETGAFLWNLLTIGASYNELLDKMLSEYDVDRDTAENDIRNFIDKLNEGKLLADDE